MIESISIEKWQIWAGIVGVILWRGGEYIAGYFSYRSDSRAEDQRMKYLEIIANTNVIQTQNLSELNKTLAADRAIQNERHEANMRVMNILCKADCMNHRQRKPEPNAPE